MCEVHWTCPDHPPPPLEEGREAVSEQTEGTERRDVGKTLPCGCSTAERKGEDEEGEEEACEECVSPPEPSRVWSDTSSEGSLGGVFDIGYRDPSREYSDIPESIEVAYGRMENIEPNAIIGGEEWQRCEKGKVHPRTWRTGDLGFAEVILGRAPFKEVRMEMNCLRMEMVVAKARMEITAVSDLPRLSWYEVPKISWPTAINQSRHMYEELIRSARCREIRLTSEVEKVDGYNILVDLPIPCYDGKPIPGMDVVRMASVDIWQGTAEHRRGDYGPVILCKWVAVPPGLDYKAPKVFDTNPTSYRMCFPSSTLIRLELRWELVELGYLECGERMRVLCYKEDLYDTAHSCVWIDHRSIQRARRLGRKYVIVSEDQGAQFVRPSCREDMLERADEVYKRKPKCTGVSHPTFEAIVRAWKASWEDGDMSLDISKLAKGLRMRPQMAILALQDARFRLPYSSGSACALRFQRGFMHPGLREMAGIDARFIKGALVVKGEGGECVTGLGNVPVVTDEGHIFADPESEGTPYEFLSGSVGRFTFSTVVNTVPQYGPCDETVRFGEP